MEGFVSCPEEFHLIEGPFYSDELKWEDPDRARSMIEEHLIKKYSHEVLCDLKLRDGESGVDITPQDVGVGVSQIAPVLVHAFGNTGKIIAIEQPEIHIHPALQADLGDVFIESALGENKNTFLLETHSEHLILRILRRIRETAEGEMAEWPEALRKACPNGIRPEDVAVLYVQPGKEGSLSRGAQRRIDEGLTIFDCFGAGHSRGAFRGAIQVRNPILVDMRDDGIPRHESLLVHLQPGQPAGSRGAILEAVEDEVSETIDDQFALIVFDFLGDHDEQQRHRHHDGKLAHRPLLVLELATVLDVVTRRPHRI
jgi:hypothetical protein